MAAPTEPHFSARPLAAAPLNPALTWPPPCSLHPPRHRTPFPASLSGLLCASLTSTPQSGLPPTGPETMPSPDTACPPPAGEGFSNRCLWPPPPTRPHAPHVASAGPPQSTAVPRRPHLTPTSQRPALDTQRQPGRNVDKRPCLLHPLMPSLECPPSPPPWIRAPFLLRTRSPTPSATHSPPMATPGSEGHPHLLPQAGHPHSDCLHVPLDPETLSPLSLSRERATAAPSQPRLCQSEVRFAPQLQVCQLFQLPSGNNRNLLCPPSGPSPHGHPRLGPAYPRHSAGLRRSPSGRPSPSVRCPPGVLSSAFPSPGPSFGLAPGRDYRAPAQPHEGLKEVTVPQGPA